jgi:hypothetical protein
MMEKRIRAAREELVKLGVAVDSGKRLNDQIVWAPNPKLTEEQRQALIESATGADPEQDPRLAVEALTQASDETCGKATGIIGGLDPAAAAEAFSDCLRPIGRGCGGEVRRDRLRHAVGSLNHAEDTKSRQRKARPRLVLGELQRGRAEDVAPGGFQGIFALGSRRKRVGRVHRGAEADALADCQNTRQLGQGWLAYFIREKEIAVTEPASRRIQFNTQDRRAVAALDDDFTVNDNNDVAVIAGEMRVEIMRIAGGDQFRLRIGFPGGEQLDVRIARSQMMRELNVGDEK